MKVNASFMVKIVLAITIVDVKASPETAAACFQAAEALNDIPNVNKAHEALIRAYNETCKDSGLCYGSMTDELSKSLEKSSNPADLFQTANEVPLTITGTAAFDRSFKNHPTYGPYKAECEKAGGSLGCIDGDLRLVGEVGGVLAEADGVNGGNSMDIEFYVKKFPICLPSECDGEDLKEVIVDATRDAVLNSPDVQGALTPATENVLKSVTFESLCALGGPPTCELEVERASCDELAQFDYSSCVSLRSLGAIFVALVGTVMLYVL